jgi:hypothetical protein
MAAHPGLPERKIMKKLVAPMALVALLGTFIVPTAQSQNVKVDSQQKNLLLAASSTTTLQQELAQAGALGFHVLMGTTRGNAEMVLLLERDLKSAEKVEYRLVATNATGTFEKELASAATQGFRFVPGTFLNKASGIAGNEVVAVMEKVAKAGKRYEYKILATNQTSTLQSEWVVAISNGYRAVGMITRSEVMLLLEREAK